MRLFLLLFLCWGWIGNVWAADASYPESLKGSSSTQPVKFATTTITPWGISEPGQAPSGLLVSVMDSLQSTTGIAANNQMMPYPRVIYSLFSGAVDLAVLFDSPESRQSALRVGHIVDTRILIIALADRPAISSMKDLAGQNVGHMRGSKYGPVFDEDDVIRRIPVNSMYQGIAMLLRNRLYAMAGTDQAVYWAMEKMQVDPARLTVLLDFKGASGSLYMSKHSPHKDLLPVYAEALEQLHQNGSLSEIFDRNYQWSRQQDRILPDTAQQ
ncbi:MAG: transporter substrate-binding domain-containing protein [Candidatus Pelagadaptatus aseana]|uniref:substrate-binding periplasmic protein n=1 Tax=Candidatus Pelagadaptatus aseana TaxID=3120508 RepID=UPI0039B29A27